LGCPFRTPTAFQSSSPGLRSPDRYPGTQRPAKRFNPDGVAPQTRFSPPSRPEPLCGSIVTPPVPRVGLIPFGRPWAGGRKPFGLGGGRSPGSALGWFVSPRWGRESSGDHRRPFMGARIDHRPLHREIRDRQTDSSGGAKRQRLCTPLSEAASGRLRRSRPPAQGCGRQTATLGPNVPRNGSTPTGLRPKRRSRLRPGRNRFAVQSLLRPFPG
jgi:hypothetical protein